MISSNTLMKMNCHAWLKRSCFEQARLQFVAKQREKMGLGGGDLCEVVGDRLEMQRCGRAVKKWAV